MTAPTPSSGSAFSNVGSRQLYEAGDQRHESLSQIREEQRTRKHKTQFDPDADLSKKDPTAPAKLHGNTPSKGAQIDADLQADDELRLQERGMEK